MLAGPENTSTNDVNVNRRAIVTTSKYLASADVSRGTQQQKCSDGLLWELKLPRDSRAVRTTVSQHASARSMCSHQ